MRGDERYIYTLAELLEAFDVEYQRFPPFPQQRRQQLRDEGIGLREAFRIMSEEGLIPPLGSEGIDIRVESREHIYPRMSDHGARYFITDTREGICYLIKDLVHAAECGCKGCRYRIDKELEKYRSRSEG